MVEDKQYIIGEEELNQLAFKIPHYPYDERDNIVKDFLKDKQPVSILNRQEVWDCINNEIKIMPGADLTRLTNIVDAICTLIPTPIEPSDDAKAFGKELQKALEKAQMHGWEQGKKQVKTPYDFTLADETYIENIWKDLMSKLPQPKPFNEAEVREILETYLEVVEYVTTARTGKYGLKAKCKSKTPVEDLVSQLSTLTPKDNIKELYDE